MEADNEYIFNLHLSNKDKQAIVKFLFELLYSRLYFFANKIIADRVMAEDIVQEAFLKLWKNWNNKNKLAQVKSYLYTIVKHDCLNYLKHQQLKQKHLQRQSRIMIDESNQQLSIMEAEVIGELQLALNKLPCECRKIFMLSYHEEYSNQQIADVLHLSLQTVKNQKSRGYRILRGLLKNTLYFFF